MKGYKILKDKNGSYSVFSKTDPTLSINTDYNEDARAIVEILEERDSYKKAISKVYELLFRWEKTGNLNKALGVVLEALKK